MHSSNTAPNSSSIQKEATRPRPAKQSPPRHHRRGQTAVEFALTLPVLLLLMFGIVEFGRIFQSWVTIQNAARVAARFAITGQYDTNMFSDACLNGCNAGTAGGWLPNPNNLFPYDGTAPNPTHGMPCPLNPTATVSMPGNPEMDTYDGQYVTSSQAFRSHWDGIICDPTNDAHLGLQKDLFRLVGMTKAAQIGASGLRVSQSISIPGTAIDTDTLTGMNSGVAGWFNVFVCSSRPYLPDTESVAEHKQNPQPTRYTQLRADWAQRKCTVNQPGTNNGRNQYDAGGPGDFVRVTVFYNHPLITPIATVSLGGASALVPFVQLQATRTMVNESFRTSKVISLPNQGQASYTPSNTWTPSATNPPGPPPTNTLTPSRTPTNTITLTASYTPVPLCASIILDPNLVNLTTGYLDIPIRNNNGAPVYVNGATINWTSSKQPSMFFSSLMLNAQPTAAWDYQGGTDPHPGQNIGTYTLPTPPAGFSAGNGWVQDSSRSLRQFPANSTTQAEFSFANLSSDLQTIFGNDVRYFGGTSISFDLGNGVVCTKTFSASTPTPAGPPSNTPIPQCNTNSYTLDFGYFTNDGVVALTFKNLTSVPVAMVGFQFNWRNVHAGMSLDEVHALGASYGDSGALVVWQGNSTSSPTTAAAGGGGWVTSPVLNANTPSGLGIWLKFSDNVNYNTVYGVGAYNFNDSSVILDNGCKVIMNPQATPIPQSTTTDTPTITLTPTKTLSPTASRTPSPTTTPTASTTPTITLTPTKTLTPTATYTASITMTPSLTNTATKTFTPSPTKTASNTSTKTFTPSPTATYTASLPATSTWTPTATKVPSATFTSSPTSTPLPPSATPLVPTSTNTLVPIPTIPGGSGD